MRLLLDECLPRPLVREITPSDHDELAGSRAIAIELDRGERVKRLEPEERPHATAQLFS